MTRVVHSFFWLGVLMGLLAIAGCTVTRIPTCPTIAEYTPEFLTAADAQLGQSVTEGSPLDRMMQDYGSLRDQVRDCERQRGRYAD